MGVTGVGRQPPQTQWLPSAIFVLSLIMKCPNDIAHIVGYDRDRFESVMLDPVRISTADNRPVLPIR